MSLNVPEIIATAAVVLILIEIRLGMIRRRLPNRRLRICSHD